MDEHREAVKVIAAKVRSFYERKEQFRIYHGTTNCTRLLSFHRERIIDTTDLNKVIRVDRVKRKALVEPNVSMEQLADATLQSGLVPKVCMEFPSITVGGGFSGTSGESSSFKHGFFEHTVSWIEIVLANGEVVQASPTTNEDLFKGAAGTFGTIGVITLLEVQLIPAKPYVELTYLPVSSVSEAIQKLKEATEDEKNDYVDGILFNQQKGVIMTGRLTQAALVDVDIVRFSRSTDPWFYVHAEERLALNPTSSFAIAIPLTDYLFRYDRGAFWGGKYAFQYFVTPFNSFTRYLLDSLLRTKVMYHALHESGLGGKYIVQDIGFPISTVEQFIEYLGRTFGHYPLWLCPIRTADGNPLHARPDHLKNDTVVNVGVWGPGPTNKAEFFKFNREMEQKAKELSGLKCLYARSYYTEDEFWDVYDRKWYDALRAKYDANSLPSLYEKVKFDPKEIGSEASGVWSYWPLSYMPEFWDIWPIAGAYGAFKAWLGVYSPVAINYILAKQ